MKSDKIHETYFRFKTIEPSGVILSTSDEWSEDRFEMSLVRGGLVLNIRMDGHETVMLSGGRNKFISYNPFHCCSLLLILVIIRFYKRITKDTYYYITEQYSLLVVRTSQPFPSSARTLIPPPPPMHQINPYFHIMYTGSNCSRLLFFSSTLQHIHG